MDLEHVLTHHGGIPTPAMRSGTLQIGFHQTTAEAATKIIHSQEGFHIGNKGMYGAGIYFACELDHTIGKARSYGVAFACLVDVGRQMTVTHGCKHVNLEILRSQGYDSVYGAARQRPEIIVYEPHRVLKFVCLSTDRIGSLMPGGTPPPASVQAQEKNADDLVRYALYEKMGHYMR